MTIKTVAVIGASGNVGAPVVQALLSAGYTVSAITRTTSTSTFPPSVNVIKADLTSLESLTSAFTGQDAVIATIAASEIGNQTLLVDAAVAAGVKRFIPSEFGHVAAKVTGGLGAMIAGKAKTAAYLDEAAKANLGFTWTGIATGPFFDWGIGSGFWGVDLKAKKVRVIDSGDELVSSSTLGFVGKSVVAVLQREEETVNKLIEVVEFTVSQNELVKVLEEKTGTKFEVEKVNGKELGEKGEESLAKGDAWGAFFDLLLAWNFTDGGDHAVKEEELANGWLGLKSQTVQEAVEEYLAKAK
ncbi:hypothetical protein B0T16DRAFT_325231 [Cercophora newfieldiana]|uniref:NmrA-like domain-containing protein n=1 Tax=Cercophora newfieldiana TaxID=92897 RepID=A0AA39YE56_9PEZI|nr:hypothetical protein B0T16DRAFT_325231 [Cercophora newfieldiana]